MTDQALIAALIFAVLITVLVYQRSLESQKREQPRHRLLGRLVLVFAPESLE